MEPTANTYDPRVSCPSCIRNLDRYGIAAARRIGNLARPDMGHKMAFTPSGRIALCGLTLHLKDQAESPAQE